MDLIPQAQIRNQKVKLQSLQKLLQHRENPKKTKKKRTNRTRRIQMVRFRLVRALQATKPYTSFSFIFFWHRQITATPWLLPLLEGSNGQLTAAAAMALQGVGRDEENQGTEKKFLCDLELGTDTRPAMLATMTKTVRCNRSGLITIWSSRPVYA